MFNGIENLLSISLRLSKSNPLVQTIWQTPGQNLNSRPNPYFVKRRRLQRLYLYKILIAVDFHSIT